MRSPTLALLAALALGTTFVGDESRAYADDAPSAEALQKAAVHFKAAREFYAEGAYGKAIAELERARAFDPTAKDLIFNLATVCEKAGRTEDAINYFKEYLQQNPDGAERAKVQATVKRLEGVLADQQKTAPPPPQPDPKTAPPQLIYVPTPVESPPRGRLDALTVSLGVLAIAGLGVGGTFGVLALTTRPAQGLTTGSSSPLNVSYADLEERTNRAHTFAIISDIGFLVGVLATGATLGVFFGRTKYPAADTGPTATSSPEAPKKKPKTETSFTIAPTAGGAAFVLGGTF
jgi:tetratricopeptide (TPR) repeat protein